MGNHRVLKSGGNDGQSLVQVLVAIAIMGILAVGMMTMQSSMAHENNALTEKLSALDLEKNLIAAMKNGATCGFQLAQLSSPPEFDIADVTATKSPAPIDLGNYLYSNPSVNAPVATVGQIASPISKSVVVKDIQLANIRCPPPCDPSASNQFLGEIVVGMDATKLARSLIGVRSQVTLQTQDVSAGRKRVVGCQGTSFGSGSSATLSYAYTRPTGQGSGTYTPYTWNTVPLNVEQNDSDDLGALNGHQIVLQPGVYTVQSTATIRGANQSRIRIRDVDSGTTLLSGMNAGGGSYMEQTFPNLFGTLELHQPATLELQVYQNSGVTLAMQALSTGEDEVYAVVHFTKLR